MQESTWLDRKEYPFESNFLQLAWGRCITSISTTLSRLKSPRNGKGFWVFQKRIIESSEWLVSLWSQREKIQDKPALLLWGIKDIAFRGRELNTYVSLFLNSTVIKYNDVGHFVQEEKDADLCPAIVDFLK